MLTALVVGSALGGCYLAHGEVEPALLEVGPGCDAYEETEEPTPVPIRRHYRGGWGLCAVARVRSFDLEYGALRIEAVDPATGETVAAPRWDEQPQLLAEEGESSIYGGGLLLLELVDRERVDALVGRPLRLEARWSTSVADHAIVVDAVVEE